MAQYEYGIVVRTTEIKQALEELERMDQEQLSADFVRGLGSLTNEVTKMLQTPEMKGWK